MFSKRSGRLASMGAFLLAGLGFMPTSLGRSTPKSEPIDEPKIVNQREWRVGSNSRLPFNRQQEIIRAAIAKRKRKNQVRALVHSGAQWSNPCIKKAAA